MDCQSFDAVAQRVAVVASRCGAGGPCRGFVTENQYGGNPGGLAVADTISQQTAADSEFVWTHTLADGTAAPSDDQCGNWTAAAVNGGRGSHTSAAAGWTASGSSACSTGQHLYCFQQSGR